jgi:hypothetical protein
MLALVCRDVFVCRLEALATLDVSQGRLTIFARIFFQENGASPGL